MHHPAGHAAVDIDGHQIRAFHPLQTSGNASGAFGWYAIIQDAVLGVQQMRCDGRFAAHEAVSDSAAGINDVGFDVPSERAFDNDALHIFSLIRCILHLTMRDFWSTVKGQV